MRTKALVTGAGGFIGRAVVAALARDGYAVVAHVGPRGADLAAPAHAADAIWCDVATPRVFDTVLRDCAIVVHLAGPPAVAPSFAEPAAYVATHAVGTALLIEAARAASVSRVVYVSSAEVYGRTACERAAEDALPAPRSPYAAAKLAAEAIVTAVARSGGPQAIVLRPFSVYGPGQRASSLLATILTQVGAGTAVALRDPTPVRDYVHLDDVARAICRACAVALPATDPVALFNIGTGIGTSAGDLAALALALAGSRNAVVATGADRGPAEIFRLIADPARAATYLDWHAQIALPVGIGGLLDLVAT